MRLAAALAVVVLGLVAGGTARAGDASDDASIVFARGGALYRIDPSGKHEALLARLPPGATVRALRADATGATLLVDASGAWWSLPLDGSTTGLAKLPCGEGPAQLAEDGSAVVCRAAEGNGAIIYELVARRAHVVAVAAATARLAQPADGGPPRLVWADARGVWSAPAESPGRKVKVAPEPPLRGFLASPDGARAVGVYPSEVYTDTHHKRPAELLMGLPLDGSGARRKAIRNGVPIDWSHDSRWVLVQDGGKGCLMAAAGGEYKCWTGYAATSLASDGSWALLLGNPAAVAPTPTPAHAGGKKGAAHGRGASAKASPPAAPPPPAPSPAKTDEPSDEGGEGGDAAAPDVPAPPPSGPLGLYRGKLDGAFTTAPTLITKPVDGAAVWVPARPAHPAR